MISVILFSFQLPDELAQAVKALSKPKASVPGSISG
jgi:hypothetical protein